VSFDAEAMLAEVLAEQAMWKAAKRLMNSTQGAKSPWDAARILGRDIVDLIAEETGLDRDAVERRWGGHPHT
jgi:hypothetical protein